MVSRIKVFFINITFLAASIIAFAFVVIVHRLYEPDYYFDLPDILERGILVATTNHSPSSYFVYRAEPMGFQLEMLSAFCKHLGILLEIRPKNKIESKVECLVSDSGCDVIALRFNSTYERRLLVNFTEPYAFSRHVLVQRRNNTRPNTANGQEAPGPIRNPAMLNGQTVFIQEGTSYKETLELLEHTYGISILIVEKDINEEELIRMVAEGQIDFTVSDEVIARPNLVFFNILDIGTAITEEIGLSWAVRKNSPKLLEAVNEWIVNFRETPQFAALFRKYFEAPRRAFRRDDPYHSLFGNRISSYDTYFKRHAPIVGWDWRMIASLAFQESSFVHDTASWAGAMGIMQIMPSTAEYLGLDSLSTIEDHIKAGTRYLRSLDRVMQNFVEDSLERISFVLGAYNAGPGHVLDAIRLAEKQGRDPTKWIGNVDYFILNKSRYYRDEVVRHGYLRGWETYHHVRKIWRRYEHYRNVVDE